MSASNDSSRTPRIVVAIAGLALVAGAVVLAVRSSREPMATPETPAREIVTNDASSSLPPDAGDPPAVASNAASPPTNSVAAISPPQVVSAISPPQVAAISPPQRTTAGTPDPPKDFASALSAAAGTKERAAAAGGNTADAAFDRGAAAAALGAVNLQSCKQQDGPEGAGRVVVTFAPDGSVSSAEIDAPPFAGTTTAACIIKKFRAAHVPKFAGDPVKVGKSFNLQ